MLTKIIDVENIGDRLCAVKLKNMKGKEVTKNLPISDTELLEGFRKYNQGQYIQDAFNELDSSDREFLLTGLSDDEWADIGDEWMKDLIDDLTETNMLVNYREFVEVYPPERADQAMINVYGKAQWDRKKEKIWQAHDQIELSFKKHLC